MKLTKKELEEVKSDIKKLKSSNTTEDQILDIFLQQKDKIIKHNTDSLDYFIENYRKKVFKYGFKSYKDMMIFDKNNISKDEINQINNLGYIYGGAMINQYKIKGTAYPGIDNGIFLLGTIVDYFCFEEIFDYVELNHWIQFIIEGRNGSLTIDNFGDYIKLNSK